MATTATGDNIVPRTLNAGDTWQFTLSFANYPATQGWSASLILIGANAGSGSNTYTFSATVNSNGTDFNWLVTTAQTSPIPAGDYNYRVIVIGSGAYAGQQFCADPPSPIGGYGRVTISPNFALLTNLDPRSIDEQQLASLETTISAISGNPTASATFGGQTFTVFDLDKLKAFRVYLRECIKDQKVRQNVKDGKASGRQAQIRFVDPSFPATGYPYQNRG